MPNIKSFAVNMDEIPIVPDKNQYEECKCFHNFL